MKKSFPVLLLSAMMIFLIGCGGGNNSDKIEVKTAPNTQQETETTEDKVVVKVNKTTVEAGKTVDFVLSNTQNIKLIEWRDKNGKLLSTDLKLNRLFFTEGEYETILVVTDKNDKITTDKIVIKVIKNSTPTNVTPNQSPVAKAKAESLSIMDKEYIHLSDDESYDSDGSIASYEWRDMDGILLSSTKKLDRKMYYYPQYDFNNNGTTRYVKTLIVTDDKGATAKKSFTIIVHKKPDTNQPPTVDAGANQTITQGDSLTLNATADDSDGSIEGYEWKEGGVVKGDSADLTLNNLSVGTHFFTITVTDDKGATASDTVKVEVKAPIVINQAPTATLQSVTLDEDTTKTIILSGTDPDGDALTYTVVSIPSNGTLSGTVPNLIYTPNANYFGSDSFTFKVNDGTVDSAPAMVSIAITNIVEPNQAPIATPQNVTLDEDTTKIITLSGTDPDGNTLTYTVVTQPTNGTFVGGVYTPNANYNGNDSFIFVANDGLLTSLPATVSITVSSVNDTPTAIAQSIALCKNTSKNIVLIGSDDDNDTLTYDLTTLPTNGIFNGITYTPNPDYIGTDSFSFKANDGQVSSASAIVDIVINGDNLSVNERFDFIANYLESLLDIKSDILEYDDSPFILDEGETRTFVMTMVLDFTNDPINSPDKGYITFVIQLDVTKSMGNLVFSSPAESLTLINSKKETSPFGLMTILTSDSDVLLGDEVSFNFDNYFNKLLTEVGNNLAYDNIRSIFSECDTELIKIYFTMHEKLPNDSYDKLFIRNPEIFNPTDFSLNIGGSTNPYLDIFDDGVVQALKFDLIWNQVP